MGFIFDPSVKEDAYGVLESIMLQTKQDMEHCLPFAMDPVCFKYNVNEHGTVATLYCDDPVDDKNKKNQMSSSDCCTSSLQDLNELLLEQGFDATGQEQIRADLLSGNIGLAKNRLPSKFDLTDVIPSDVTFIEDSTLQDKNVCGLEALKNGSVGIVTLAAGVGSRWTQGAGVVKALHPFCCIGGKHRCFLDVHLAKNRRVSSEAGCPIPHVITTSWMMDAAISGYIESCDKSYREIPIYVSKGQTIGLRMIPTERDLKFLLSEQPRLESNAEKVRESVHNSLINWAKSCGEGSEYRDNSPSQCLSPVGHWYEFSNLLLNGTLAKMLRDRPQLQTLMLHNIDKIGVDVNTNILGKFLESKSTLAYEVVPRRIDDMGGGLFRVNGKPLLVESLALPTDEDELKFSYYNSLTTWIDIDKLLTQFGLSRHDILESTEIIPQAINEYSKSPSYLCHH